MRCSAGHPGARHDFEIYSEQIGTWIERLHKTPEERQHSTTNHEYWSQLADKGYQGANNLAGVHMHHPMKKPRGRRLTAAQKSINRKISADRIVCENYYGRMKQLWKLMRDKWRFDRSRYASMFTLCLALTNYHILCGNHLRAEEGQWYRGYRARLAEEAEQAHAKRKKQFADSRRRQQRRRLGLGPDSEPSTPSTEE
jgi:hypothetical protein